MAKKIKVTQTELQKHFHIFHCLEKKQSHLKLNKNAHFSFNHFLQYNIHNHIHRNSKTKNLND